MKNCAQPAVDSYTCTAKVCSILITGCVVKVAWSKVTVIGRGLPKGVAASREGKMLGKLCEVAFENGP